MRRNKTIARRADEGRTQRTAGGFRTGPPFTRVDAALLLLLAGLVALFFWRILTPNPADRAQFPPGDFTDQFYAFRLYISHAFAEGRIPLWSESFNSGHPFLADIQSQVFYPIALANALLNLAVYHSFSLFALEIEALLHFYLAGAFLYLFARRVLARWVVGITPETVRAGAFTSALGFTFGGYLTSYPPLQLAILETAAWLPFALYCVERALDDGFVGGALGTADNKLSARRRSYLPAHAGWLIAAGMALGIAALAGHPQTFLFVVAVCVLYLTRRTFQTHTPGERGDLLRIVAQTGIMLFIAFGIAAVQLIPAIEYQQLSTREALSFADAARGFPTLDILQFILPGYASAFASPLYVGIVPLWLAIFALVSRRTRERGGGISDIEFWGLLALGSLILSFGFYVFAYVVLYLFVPGAALFRGQERLAFVVSFALAMLAGYGMAALLTGSDQRRARKLYALLPVGAALMVALLLAFFVAGTQNTQGRVSFLGDRAGLMLLVFALASLVLGLVLRKRFPARWFVPLALVLILFDTWSVNEPANKGVVQDRFADIPFAQELSRDRDIFRVAADEAALPGHFGIPTGLQEIGGISPLRLARYDVLLKLPPSVFLPLLNVQYAVTRTPEKFGGQVMGRENDLAVVKLQTSRPRAWMVGSAIVEPDDLRTAESLANGFDFTQNAIVATQPPFAPAAGAAQGTVTQSANAPERAAFEVNTPAPGLLVVSENFYPGWRAAVDGQRAEILRADLTLRAVAVPEGKHHVETWYDPFSFQLGAAISALSVLLCVGTLLFLRYRRN